MIEHKCPFLSVDVLIYVPEQKSIVLVERKYDPLGLALPGGHVDYGERVEKAAIREVKEETNLDVFLIDLLGVYSDPKRDPRKHMVSIVYIGLANDITKLKAADDAKAVRLINIADYKFALYDKLCFDHAQIIRDFIDKYETLNGVIAVNMV